MNVQSIMSPDPICVTSSTSIQECARLMRQSNVGLLPVIVSADDSHLKGVITDRDITIRVVADGLDAETTTVGEVMTQGPVTCGDLEDSLETVMERMGEAQLRRLPITDTNGQLMGIVSQADVATHASSTKAGAVVAKISRPTSIDNHHTSDNLNPDLVG